MTPINASPISPIQAPTLPSAGVAGGASAGSASGPSFKDLLLDSIQNVNHMQVEADQAVEALFTGGDVNPAEVLTAVQKADLAFRLTMQIRNKVMDVYQEIKDIRI
ncbi:flagellar hook-basal body protein FliE [Pirellulimonas nuda]|uniref:Flagellar hook-basal body complex protein FliE n=1 Tax=Pirellulimonas nuda TaxID=2528009 RepID=A0A518D9R6_9BACT|nr:flagellar hook-basal body complex protein FliE [Pirellulimonas nuda]QDU88235.1 flagellar hook-basal body protein FliE [Pirellulimonas nuda]